MNIMNLQPCSYAPHYTHRKDVKNDSQIIRTIDTVFYEIWTSYRQSRSIYIYGIECFISEFIGNLLLLIVAILWHQISAMIIWTLSFLLIRTQLGGFHCKTHFSCLCLSTSIGIFSLLINRFWLYHPSFCIPTYIACLFIIYHFAPIKHPNHPLSANQIQHARAKCLRNFFVLSVLSVILYLCHLPYYSSICSGIISSCILALMSLKKQFPTKTDMLIL